MDQHWDDYADNYYNYLPKPHKQRIIDSDEEIEADEDKFVQMDPIEKVWDLNNDKIFISKRLMSRAFTELQENEEINISYGERANSFLLIEYGFTQLDNRYDFVRLTGVTLDTIMNEIRDLGLQTSSFEEAKMKLNEL